MTEHVQINRNFLWAGIFIDQLVDIGVRYACVSPGSRSTPLALACANNKKLKTYVHIDERSGAFFALGIAKRMREPVVLVCTSGTAAAEFFPAVIESFQQNVPLIVCTADRPPELQECGANQTINQTNLYGNHSLWFFDTGLPEIIPKRLRHIRTIARRAFETADGLVKGPVHINFPFRKPLEPGTYTDSIDKELISENTRGDDCQYIPKIPFKNRCVPDNETVQHISAVFKKTESGLIIVGPGDFDEFFPEKVTKLASKLAYPILADGASQLRFGAHNKDFIFSHYDAFLKSDIFRRAYRADCIVQFSGNVSSKGLESYLEELMVFKIHINPSGRWLDPPGHLHSVIQTAPESFCEMMLNELKQNGYVREAGDWFDGFRQAEETASSVFKKFTDDGEKLFEGSVITTVLESVPAGAHLMISNSMPIRDLEYFGPVMEKKIRVHANRGASGIDGINSTALGIASVSDAPVFLITGDLAFYHDLNGLLASSKYGIPLTIIVINNNGGGIFEMLPIAAYRENFEELFLTPHNINFGPIVTAYEGIHIIAGSRGELEKAVAGVSGDSMLNVIEVQTDAAVSARIRRKYWENVCERLENR